MAWGCRFINDSGAVQIDQDYMNLCYKSRFTVSGISRGTFNLSYMGGDLGGTGDPEGPGTFYIVDYPVANNPVIAVQPPMGVSLAPVNLLNETSTGTPPAGGYKRLVFTASGSTAYTISVFVFDSVPSTAPSGTGMVVRDASNNIIFNAPANRPIRITRGITVGGLYQGANYAVSSSASYAFVYANVTGGVYYPTGMSNAKTACLVQSSSTNVTVGHTPYFSYSPVSHGGVVDYNPYIAMLIDVTGY